MTQHPVRLLAARLAAAAWLAAAAGCRQDVYHAASLPPQWTPPPVVDARRVDLSRLAAPAAPSDVIHPGDILEVSVATGVENEPPVWKLRVSDTGTVNVPLVGPVLVGGRELTDAERAIQLASVQRGVYQDPQVSVVLADRRTNRVTVIGEVEEPGGYDLPVSNSDLLSAIVAAGGLSEEAGTVVEIRRPPAPGAAAAGSPGGNAPAGYPPPGFTRPAVRVDLARPELANPGDLRLEDGAVVMVMRRPKRVVYVIGLVRDPQEIEIPPDRDLRLLDALAQAGDRTLQLADKVRIVRQAPGRAEPVVIEASVKEAKQGGPANIRLADGDIVSVEETPLTFAIDMLRSFIRFGFTSTVPGI